MTVNEYRIISNEYDKEYSELSKEWIRLHGIHNNLNKEIERIFKCIEGREKMDCVEAEYYLRIRTENDIINSQFKTISTKTNDIWIKRQILDLQMLKEHSPEVLISAVDRENGRIKIYLNFKE